MVRDVIDHILNIKSLFLGLWIVGACQTPQKSVGNSSSAYYTEDHRPQIHFSPDSMWMNDPNGMVYYEGEYHLFYQYHPESTVWGPMHWGHAVSPDLVHWEHLPIGIFPDSLGTIFSGSAVVDRKNTSGFGEEGKPPLIAIFTQHSHELYDAGSDLFQTQGIAYSNDKGRTWTKYEGNPVIPNPGIRDFRDPKVRWHEESQHWVMIFAAKDRVKIYTSPNLKTWTQASEFGKNIGTHAGVWECPDLFPLQVEGSTETKWVMLVSINPGGPNGGSATQYFVGDFDGKTFTLDSEFATRLGSTKARVPQGRLYDTFEGGDFGEWKVEGEAFGSRPSDGRVGEQQEVLGFTDKRLINSFHGGDASTGILSSPIFVNEYPYINFQIGGGRHPGSTAIQLWADGEIVRTATGNNSEKLRWHHWDVSEFLGRSLQIKIVDAHEGGWGHILVDQILFANEPATPAIEKAKWLEYGRDNYAGVTWSDIPESDGRRIFLGWMSNWDYAQRVPTSKWRSAMTLPRALELVEVPQGLTLRSQPVKELTELRLEEMGSYSFPSLETDTPLMSGIKGPIEAILEFEVDEDSNKELQVGLELSNSVGEFYRVLYDRGSNSYVSDRTLAGKKDFSDIFAFEVHDAPRLTDASAIQMHLYFDLASMELFADQGLTVMTDIFFPNQNFSQLRLVCKGGKIKGGKLTLHSLGRIWE
ncbi:MAG: glycoside hydrolase family 32 protein [Bacteroidota bacterium]